MAAANKDSVKPTRWVPSNKAAFPNWMYETFHPDKYHQDEAYSCSAPQKKLSLFSHQKIVRDYLQTSSPYRGVLLFHGLGVGKTCASIAAAEDFIDKSRKVFVMLPASLENNYRKDILNCSRVGMNRRKQWRKVTLHPTKSEADQELLTRLSRYFRYTPEFIQKNTTKSTGQVSLWIPFTPKTMDIPEAQVEQKPFKEYTKQERREIDDTLQFMIEYRYTFIRYNGLSKAELEKMPENHFDNAFVIIDEAHNFISQATHPKTLKYQLYMRLLKAKNTKFILLSGTPVINDPFELAFSLNLVRGPITRHVFALPKDLADVPMVEDVRAALKAASLSKFVDYIHVYQDTTGRGAGAKKAIELTFTPRGMEFASDEALVELKPSLGPTKGDDAPVARVQKVIQTTFNTESPKVYSDESAYPMERKDFYKMYIDESKERPTLINQDLFMRRAMGLVSFYKTKDINIFPEKLPTEMHHVPLTDYQFKKYVEYRNRERNLTKQAAINPLKDVSSVYRAYTRMVGNFVFPDAVPRHFPHDIRLLRKAEIDTEFEELRETMGDAIDAIDDKGVKRKIADAKYKQSVDALLPALADAADKYLTPKELATMYSPKMAALLKHLGKSKGKSLIYSQFNSVEGLGVLKLVLKQNGWAEIELESAGSGTNVDWRIKNAAEVLDPKFTGKRFISFNTNRDITNVLMNVLNGNMEILPPTVREQLRAAGYTQREDNFRGAWATCILISQSGAEGINLKHIRNVFILEPFWNQVRIDQVIGRAIRTCSHSELPPEERNVRVIMYVAVFTEEQKKQDMSISRQDNGYSSDQYIFMMSTNKNSIIQGFLNLLIRASVDCLSNSQRSKVLKDYKLSCYAYPVNVSPESHGFTPSYNFDYQNVDSISQRLIKTKGVRGKAVMVRGKKYIRVEGYGEPTALYDYNAYKNAGVLVPATQAQ